MPPRRERIPRAREAASWLGGILVLGILMAGVVGAAVLLWENLDVRQLVPELAESPPVPSLPILSRPATAVATDHEVLLFVSQRNADFFPDPGYYGRSLTTWRRLLSATGASVREISTAAEVRGAGGRVVVMPEAPCLSNGERSAVADHLRRGGSIVANWAIGARDAACEWLGWRPVAGLIGADDLREIPPREALYLAVPREVPFAPGLAPGTRIELRPDPSLAAWAEGPRVYWSDWGLDPAPDESGGGADGAAVARRTGAGGRVVWFGFRLDQGATPRDAELLGRVVRNGVIWAAGIPQAEVAAWPHAKRAALMLSVDVESRAENAGRMAERLSRESMRATWFAVSREVLGDAALADRLVGAGEIATQTPDNTPVVGLTGSEQQIRLRRAAADIERWSGRRPTGLRPPEEAFDRRTVEAWSAAGGRYLVGLNDARSASPELHAVGADGTRPPMVAVPRLVKDDYNVFVQDGEMRSARLAEAWVTGAEKVRALGGVAVLAAHSQILDSEARRDAVVGATRAIEEQGGWWLATGSEVAEWWRSRGAARVRAVAPAPHGAGTLAAPGGTGPEDGGWGVEVRAGPEGLHGGYLELVVPVLDDRIPLRDGIPVPYERTVHGLRVPLGEMAPGETRVIALVSAPEPT